jgi:hypothetical protein
VDETRRRRARRNEALASIKAPLNCATFPVRAVVVLLFGTFFLVVSAGGGAFALLVNLLNAAVVSAFTCLQCCHGACRTGPCGGSGGGGAAAAATAARSIDDRVRAKAFQKRCERRAQAASNFCVSAVLVVAVPPFLIALVAVNIGWNLLVTTFVLLPALTCFAPCAQLGRDVSGSHAME